MSDSSEWEDDFLDDYPAAPAPVKAGPKLPSLGANLDFSKIPDAAQPWRQDSSRMASPSKQRKPTHREKAQAATLNNDFAWRDRPPVSGAAKVRGRSNSKKHMYFPGAQPEEPARARSSSKSKKTKQRPPASNQTLALVGSAGDDDDDPFNPFGDAKAQTKQIARKALAGAATENSLKPNPFAAKARVNPFATLQPKAVQATPRTNVAMQERIPKKTSDDAFREGSITKSIGVIQTALEGLGGKRLYRLLDDRHDLGVSLCTKDNEGQLTESQATTKRDLRAHLGDLLAVRKIELPDSYDKEDLWLQCGKEEDRKLYLHGNLEAGEEGAHVAETDIKDLAIAQSLYACTHVAGVQYLTAPSFDQPCTKDTAGVPLTEAGEPMCIRGEIVAALAVLVGEGGVRFMLCSGSHLWLPLTTAAGTENFEETEMLPCCEAFHVVTPRGIAYRSNVNGGKVAGSAGVDHGAVVAVRHLCTLDSGMQYVLCAATNYWLPTMLDNGEPLLERVPVHQTANYFQVASPSGVAYYTGPSFAYPNFVSANPNEQTQCSIGSLIAGCCTLLSPEGVEFMFSTSDEMEQARWLPVARLKTGEVWLKEIQPSKSVQLYRVTQEGAGQPFMARAMHGRPAPGAEVAEQGALIASRLEMPIIDGVIDPEERLVLCALRRQWLPVCTVSGVEVLEQLGPGTGVVLKVGKIGLKNAMEEAYKQSYVEVSLVDRDPKMQYYNKEIKSYCDWTVVAKPQRTKFAKETEHETSVASWAQYLVFDHEIILPLSREQILQRPGLALFFEFKHYKPEKRRDSCKCYSYISHNDMTQLRAGSLELMIWRCEKPTNYVMAHRKRLSVKPLYLHVEIQFETGAAPPGLQTARRKEKEWLNDSDSD